MLVPVVMEEADPPPMPMSIPGPPSCTSSAPAGTSPLWAWPARTLPTPPATMIGLWYPRATAGDLLLVGAKVAGEVGAAELVAEGGGADRALDHDRERRGDAVGARLRALPRALVAGEAQVGDREAAQARLGLGAPAGRALVADLAPRAGGGPGKRRDRGRVVVGLHLHQRVRPVLLVEVAPGPGLDEEAAGDPALDHRRVVRVRAHRPGGARLLRLPDHLEERLRLRPPSTTHEALKILWRQCSEFAWANIVSSTSVGFRRRPSK